MIPKKHINESPINFFKNTNRNKLFQSNSSTFQNKLFHQVTPTNITSQSNRDVPLPLSIIALSY